MMAPSGVVAGRTLKGRRRCGRPMPETLDQRGVCPPIEIDSTAGAAHLLRRMSGARSRSASGDAMFIAGSTRATVAAHRDPDRNRMAPLVVLILPQLLILKKLLFENGHFARWFCPGGGCLTRCRTHLATNWGFPISGKFEKTRYKNKIER